MSLYSVKVSLKLRAGVAQRPIFALVRRLQALTLNRPDRTKQNYIMKEPHALRDSPGGCAALSCAVLLGLGSSILGAHLIFVLKLHHPS